MNVTSHIMIIIEIVVKSIVILKFLTLNSGYNLFSVIYPF